MGLVLMAAALVGCSSPAVRSQRLVAKPNMTFSSSAAFSYNSSKLMPQLAPGSNDEGGRIGSFARRFPAQAVALGERVIGIGDKEKILGPLCIFEKSFGV